MAYITRSYFYRSYQNYRCNDVCCFFLLLYGFMITFPFFVAYTTDSKASSNDDYFEQPFISYTNQYAVECVDIRSTYFFSTMDSLSSMNQFTVKPNVVTTITDTNQDSKPEQITFTLGIPALGFSPTSCVLLVTYNVGLRDFVRLQMQAPIIFQFSTNFSQYSVLAQGNLQIQQKGGILVSKVTRNIYNNTNFDPVLSLIQIQQQLLKRNETLNAITNSYYIPKQTDQQPVELSLNLKVPVFQKITYVPPIISNLRSMWQQYVFLLIPTAYFTNLLGVFGVKRRIFYAHITSNLPTFRVKLLQ